MSVLRALVAGLVTVATMLLILPAWANETAEARLLTIDDILALKIVSDPQISPEGDWIAYTVEYNDEKEDSQKSLIFMVSRDGESVVQLTGADYSASAPRWSADGKYLGFLAARGEDQKSQVWTLDRRGGDARQYTRVPQGVNGFAWSPDGKQMLLLIKDQSEAEKEDDAARLRGEDAGARPWVIDRLQFKQDYVGYLDRTRTHIYLLPERDAAPLQLTFGDQDDSSPVWSPDGTHIAFVSNRTEEPDSNTNSDIWIVAATGDDEIRDARQLTTNEGEDYVPSWSNDGEYIAYVTVTDLEKLWYATNQLAFIPAAGGKSRLLTAALDRNVSRPAFSSDDSAIYFGLEDSGESHLARIDLATENISRPFHGQASMRDFRLHRSGVIAALISRPHMPAEIFLLQGDDLRQLTGTNAELLQSIKLAEVQEVTFDSADGTGIEGFVYTPPGYRDGKRYPTLLRIHGGPVSQYDFGFSAEAQLFAANGYVVVMINPRGSSGYGEEFSVAIFADWGGKDFDDVMAGVDHVIELGIADPDRLGVGGWSYGGILTNNVITKTTRFKGAITGASEVIYIANYGHDIYQYIWEKELGLPWENREAWERITPFYNVAKVTTPTLIMGGKEDWNVPIINSEQLYQALKRLGVTTELVVYPGEFHGFQRPSFIRDRYQRYLDWYDLHVKGENIH